MVGQSPEQTTPNAEGNDRTMRVARIVLSLCAVALALLCTSRYGVGTTPDSASYLSAARSLLAGKGFLYFDSRVYTQWPPLFPTLLALFGAVGIEPLTGARLLNSAAFGAIVFLASRLFAGSTASRAFTLLGTVAVLLSAPLLTVSIMTWSEPVFIVLMLSFVLLLARFLNRPSLSALLAVSAVAALACLQRYAGVTLILAGSLLIVVATSKASVVQRLKYLVAFGVVSATPLALWLLRNRLAGATVGGHSFRPASVGQLTRAFSVGLDTLVPWFFTARAPYPARIIGLGIILALAAVLAVVAHVKLRERGRSRLTHVATVVAVGTVYFCFLATSAAGLGWDPEPRLMAPLYVLAMVLVATGAEAALHLLQVAESRQRWLAPAGIGVCALWLLYPLTETYHSVRHSWQHGPGGYSTPAWQQSAMMAWLRQHPLDGAIYSNVPDAVYILTGATAETTPHHYWTPADFAHRMAYTQASQRYVVWSYYLRWHFLYELQELISRYEMQEIASFPDGKVFRLLGEAQGPPAFAVYRFWSPRTSKHRYTVDKAERDRLVNDRSGAWVYEGPAFHVFMTCEAPMVPVYRFRSEDLGIEFYTIDEQERDKLTASDADWTDEGIAWYAYAEKARDDLAPVHRLWSDRLGYHFYTASEDEKTKLSNDPAHTWTDEGIAWYAYGP